MTLTALLISILLNAVANLMIAIVLFRKGKVINTQVAITVEKVNPNDIKDAMYDMMVNAMNEKNSIN